MADGKGQYGHDEDAGEAGYGAGAGHHAGGGLEAADGDDERTGCDGAAKGRRHADDAGHYAGCHHRGCLRAGGAVGGGCCKAVKG